jgi:hypothetical protein
VIPARVEARPRTCSTCAHHARPQWPTAGMGTCGEVVRRGHLNIIGQGYVATHETFACGAWEGKR